MTYLVGLAAALAAGVVLGAAYFRGLWLTVNALERSKSPAVTMAGSLILRFALVLAAFYLITRFGGWQHLLTAAAGFMVPRFIMVRRVWSRRPCQDGER